MGPFDFLGGAPKPLAGPNPTGNPMGGFAMPGASPAPSPGLGSRPLAQPGQVQGSSPGAPPLGGFLGLLGGLAGTGQTPMAGGIQTILQGLMGGQGQQPGGGLSSSTLGSLMQGRNLTGGLF